MNRRIRGLAVASAVVVATATAISAGPAGAATDTFTRITTPKGPGQPLYQFANLTGSPPPITFTGTVSPDVRTGGTGLDIFCFVDNDHQTTSGATPLNASLVTVNPDNTFSVSLSLAGVIPCVLRALPHGETTFDSNGHVTAGNSYFAAYAGPTFYLGGYARQPATGKLLAGETIGFGKQAIAALLTADFGGIDVLTPINDFSHAVGAIFDTNSTVTGTLDFTSANLVPTAGTPTRSSLEIDGHHIYGPATLSGFVPPAHAASIPTISWTHTRSSTTGELSQTESLPLSWCAGNGYPQSSGSPTCTVKPSGVTFKRTMVTSHQTAVVRVRDSFVSTDHKKHAVSAEYQSIFVSQSKGRMGFMLPGHSSFTAPTPNSTVNSLPPGAHTIFGTTDIHAADGASDRSDLGVTYSAKPQLYWATAKMLGLRYNNRTIPAGGAFRLGFSEQVAFTVSTVRSWANAEQSAMAGKLTITSPKNGATTSSHVIKGKVTAGANGLPATVTVTSGTKHQTVPVSATGAWTASLILAPGKHTVTAKATDPGGIPLTDSVSFKHS